MSAQMKDKLRELAERWKNRDYDDMEHLQWYAMGIRQARDELLAILDAEGDGGAVVDTVSLESALAAIDHVEQHNGPGRSSQARAMLETVAHPARSGVVSDEDADKVGFALIDAGWRPPTGEGKKTLRAALEHFAGTKP